jgi:hypothetical protein
VIGRRLCRHHLLQPAPSDRLAEVVSEICGAHAQVGASAELMLGLRVAGITRQDVRTALWRTRSLVKTVGLRGTLHLFSAEEVPLWMAVNRLRFDAEERHRARRGIDAGRFHAVVEAISDAVGPEPITRPELEAAIAAKAGTWALQRNEGWVGNYMNWPLALGWAAALGRVCYGPGEGGRVTYVRLADWSGWREEDPFQAGLFALRRFLHAYGPSTPAEFCRWLALEPAVVRSLFEAAEPELEPVDVESSRRWLLAVDAAGDWLPATDAAHLLPHFDQFVVGSHPREQLIPPGSPVAVASPGTAAPLAVLLLGGQVAGVWQRQAKGKRLLVRVDSYVGLSRRQKMALTEQATRVAEILELSLELEFGAVPLRKHL